MLLWFIPFITWATVLIRYGGYIFSTKYFSTFKVLIPKYSLKNRKVRWKPKFAFSTLFGLSGIRQVNITYSARVLYFFPLNIFFLLLKFWYQNTTKNNMEGTWKPKFLFSILYDRPGVRRANSTYSVCWLHFFPTNYFFYIRNFCTKILTKIIQRAHGSRNLHVPL